MVVDELIAVLGFDVKNEEAVKRFNQSLEKTAANIIKVGAVATAAAAGALAFLGKSVINTSAQFESYAATLETIEGSAEKASTALNWISDFAKKTPYDVAELTEAFVKLKAYGMDPTTGLLEDLGNASSGMGKSLMQAVEMIADASTGEFERIKEFGIKAKQEGQKVTFSWTENGKQLSKTVNKTSDEITKFIRERFSARFNGAMIRQSKTWNGMVSNLGDTWVDFQRKIGEAGFFDAAKRGLGRFIDYLGEMESDGRIDKLAQALGRGFEAAVEGAVTVLDRMRRHFEFLSNWAGSNPDLFNKIAYGLGLIALVKFPFLGALFVFDEILTWMEDGDSIIGDFAAALNELTGIDVDTLGTIIATLAGGASLAMAVGGFAAVIAPIKGLAAALGVLGGGGAAAGMAVLGRLGLIGAGAAATVTLAEKGKEAILNDPVKKQRHEEGEAMINRWRSNVRGFLYGSGEESNFDTGRFGSGNAPYLEDAFRNYAENRRKMLPDQAAASTSRDAAVINDSRNQAVTVQVGGVTVNGVQNANGAVGAAVGAAIGGAAAKSGRDAMPPSRIVGGGL
jgi:phage tail tape-measure protein